MKEIAIGGVYVAPLAGHLVGAALLFLLVRRYFLRDLERRVWHPPLFQLCVFVILLAFLVLLF